MIRRPPRSTLDRSSAASDVYKRQTYHFLITGDGTIFQTNALDTVSEQTVTPAVNADGVAVAFAGNFTDVPPTAAQISSGARLVAWLLQELKLTADVVVGRREPVSYTHLTLPTSGLV